MKVTVYPTNQPPKTVEVSTITDLQKLVGVNFAFIGSHRFGEDVELLVNDDGLRLNLPRNKHYPPFVGDVVLAPSEWDELPYGN